MNYVTDKERRIAAREHLANANDILKETPDIVSKPNHPKYKDYLKSMIGHYDMMAEVYDNQGKEKEWDRCCKARDRYFNKLQKAKAS